MINSILGLIIFCMIAKSTFSDSNADVIRRLSDVIATTTDLEDNNPSQYWDASTYKIADIHNFHPETNDNCDGISLPVPEIGGTYWWADHNLDGYDAVGVAFTNAIIDETTMQILYESALSDLVYKSWSYNGAQGQYHEPMFQVRGSPYKLVNAHVAYRMNLANKKEWKRLGIKRSKPAADQTSFVVNNKLFADTVGDTFTAPDTTADIEGNTPNQFWDTRVYKIADSHNFRPEINHEGIQLPTPQIGWTSWWAANSADGYEPIAVAFTNAIIDENTMQVLYESALSDLVYKPWSYSGNQGQYHRPMFQVRGSSHDLVNAHVAYRMNLDNKQEWKRIGVKLSKPAGDTAADDQISFVVSNKVYGDTNGEIFVVN